MWADLALVRDQFQVAVAPVEYVGGWALLATIGTAFVVLSSDTFAFRAHARGEALVPGAVLFVFVAALGADRHRVALTLALIAAGFLAAALLRMRFAQTPRTVARPGPQPAVDHPPGGGRRRRGGRPRRLGHRPAPARRRRRAARRHAQRRRRGHRGRSARSSTSGPASSTAPPPSCSWSPPTPPSYWRVSGLPEFDGRTWGLPDRVARGRRRRPCPSAAPGSTPNAQEIVDQRPWRASSCRAPPSRWRRRATGCAGTPRRRRSCASTGTSTRATASRCVSAMPQLHRRRAARGDVGDPARPDLPRRCRTTSRRRSATPPATVTAGAPTTYDAMLALAELVPDAVRVQPRRARRPRQRRHRGLPAPAHRLLRAVRRHVRGDGPVDRRPGPRRRRLHARRRSSPTAAASVLGKNAHAWPEVWFDGLGWVPFEPTPGRGAPGAEGYTGVPAAQDDSIPQPGQGAGGEAPATDGTVPPVEAIPGPLAGSRGPRRGRGRSGAVGDAQVRRPRHPLGRRRSLVLLVPAALLALPELVRRWRRRHPSADVARQIADLWERALGAVAGHRVPRRPDADAARAGPGRRPRDCRWRPDR